MYRYLLSVFGAGYSPFAPGTCGSAVVLVLFVAACLVSGSGILVGGVMAAAVVYGAVVTVVFGEKGIARYGNDPGMIVSDEVCGQGITYLWLLPIADWSGGQVVVFAVVGFLLFRVFDIIKPWPASRFDRIHNAWGVLLDDVAAGVYANIALQLVWRMGWLDLIWS